MKIYYIEKDEDQTIIFNSQPWSGHHVSDDFSKTHKSPNISLVLRIKRVFCYLFIYLLLIIYWNNKSSSTKQNSPRTTMVNYIEEARFASVKGQWILGNREIKEKRS